MDERAFWLAIWRSIIGGVVLLAAVIGGCVSYNNTLEIGAVQAMVAEGANAIDARCAASGFGGGGGSHDLAVCIARVVKQ